MSLADFTPTNAPFYDAHTWLQEAREAAREAVNGMELP